MNESSELVERPPEPPAFTGDIEADVPRLQRFLTAFDALPVEQKNRLIRHDKGILGRFLENSALGGYFLSMVAVQGDHDREKGQHTYLTVLKPLRDRLARDFQTKSAAESMLLDVLVMSYYQCLVAMMALQACITSDAGGNHELISQHLQPVLVRANQLFLRNLQALREIKSSPFIIKIEQPGQVNLGEKQINVSQKGTKNGPDENWQKIGPCTPLQTAARGQVAFKDAREEEKGKMHKKYHTKWLTRMKELWYSLLTITDIIVTTFIGESGAYDEDSEAPEHSYGTTRNTGRRRLGRFAVGEHGESLPVGYPTV